MLSLPRKAAFGLPVYPTASQHVVFSTSVGITKEAPKAGEVAHFALPAIAQLAFNRYHRAALGNVWINHFGFVMSGARHPPFCSAVMLLSLFTGFADIASKPGPQAQNRENAAVPAPVGHVYCVLGWLGIWSQGMNKVVSRANAELNVKAVAVGSTEWPSLVNHIAREYATGHITGPLVLVGHSLGADNQILVARALNRRRIPVDLLVLVDPNIPPHIPPNVRRCVNIFKSNDSLPGFRGLPVTSDHEKSAVENIDLRFASVGFDISTITHFNIAQVRGVQEMVLAEIAKTCPRRQL